MPMPVLRFVPSCGLSVGPMGPPYVANHAFRKEMNPTGNYAPPRVHVLPGPFQAPHGHMHLGGNPNGVLGAGDAGLAMTLVPKGTTGTRAVVKKRDAKKGSLFRRGLGAMRSSASTTTGRSPRQ